MIIDIEGILKGQRLRKCSGEARWHYGYYLLLANNFVRLELDFESLAEHFISFRSNSPKPEDIERDFKEYQDAHLVFVYTSGNRLWAQFDTKRSNTKNYRTASDKRSAAPPEAEYQSWLKEQHPEDWGMYHWNPSPDSKTKQVEPNQTVIKTSEKVIKSFEKFSGGVGVGDGVGEGINTKTKPSARKARGAEVNNSQLAKATGQTRHSRLQELIERWYQEWTGAECPWGPGEGANLKRLLDKTPNWRDEQFVTCLDHLADSDEYVPRGTSPLEWLVQLPKFLRTPLDRFGKPKVTNGNGNNKSAGATRDANNVEALVRSGLGARVQHVHDNPGPAVQDGTDGADRKPKTAIASD